MNPQEMNGQSRFKIIEHQHSGRLRPHEHTSYPMLAFLMLIVGILLGVSSITTVSADHPPPQSGSIGLTGSVPSKPPTTGAVITSPTNGQHFNSSPISVSGTCPSGTIVEIYKNDIFTGSTPCSDNGRFSVDIDPLYGSNTLTAIVYDALNQAGPTSPPVTIYFDFHPPANDPLSILNFQGTQLILLTDAVYRGTFPGESMNIPITILGGSAPYAVNVEWGDLSNKVVPRGNNTVFNVSHIYKKAGTYRITLQGTDSQDRVAFLSVAAIINGQAPVIASTNLSKKAVNKLLLLWPLYAIVLAIILSFWMGEKREKRIMQAVAARQDSPFKITPKTPTQKPA